MDVFERFGLTRVINATGTVTRLGASRIAPEVIDAMAAAAGCSIDLAELQACASRVIAQSTGAEAGIVTAGAMAGLLVGAAACMTGVDPVKMSRLPDTRGMRNEFIVPRSHRNSYDHGVRAAGGRLVEVGLADRLTHCGVRDTEVWEIASAIGEHTAGILYVAGMDARPPLSAVARAAHEQGIPVLVDAAAELPPVANLRHFIEAGADLVVFSGGKALGGPSASGILCGRRRLVGAALLQQLDLDYLFEDWQPPSELIDKREMVGVPRHGIGRACKVGKEQIVGLIAALERFTQGADAERNRRWDPIVAAIVEGLKPLRGLHVRAIKDPAHGDMPLVEVCVAQGGRAVTAASIAAGLRTGSPSIHVDTTNADRGQLLLAPTCLALSDATLIRAGFERLLTL